MNVKMSNEIQPALSELSAALVNDDFCVYVYFPRDVMCALCQSYLLVIF